MESIFFWLIRLISLIGPLTNLNLIKNKSYNENDNICKRVDIDSKVDRSNGVNNEVFWIDKLSPTNPNQTESESRSDYYNICNIVDEEILFTEEIQPNHSNLNCFKNKCYSDNTVNSNHKIGNKFGNTKF